MNGTYSWVHYQQLNEIKIFCDKMFFRIYKVPKRILSAHKLIGGNGINATNDFDRSRIQFIEVQTIRNRLCES